MIKQLTQSQLWYREQNTAGLNLKTQWDFTCKDVNLMPNLENWQGEGRGKGKIELEKKAFKHSCWGSKESTSMERKQAIKILSLVWMKFGLKITEKFKLLKQQKSPPPPNPLPLFGCKMKLKHYSRSQCLFLPCYNTKFPEKQNPLTNGEGSLLQPTMDKLAPLLNVTQNDIKMCKWHWYTLVPLRRMAQQWTTVSFYHINSKSNH